MPEAANLIYIVFKMQNAQHSTMGESKESGRSWESGRGTAEKLLKFNNLTNWMFVEWAKRNSKEGAKLKQNFYFQSKH